MGTVNLTAPTDYAAQLQDIERRRQMAQALQTQGMSPIEPNPTAGGYVIPTSWTQGLAKMLQSGLGAYQQQNLAKEQAGLSDQYRQGMKADLLKYQQDSEGTPAVPGQALPYGTTPVDSTPDQVNGMITQEAGTPAIPGDPLKATQNAMLSQYEPVQKVAGANYANLLNQQNFKQEMAAITGSMNPQRAALLTGKEPIANGAQLPGQTGFGGDPAKIAQGIMDSEMSDADKQAALAQLKEQQGTQTPAINPFLMSSNPRIQAIGTMQQKLADNKELKQIAIDAAGNRQEKGFAFQEKLRQGTQLNPTDLTLMADQYLHGDKSVFQNLGRGTQGAQNIVALRGEVSRQMNEQGLSGAAQAAKLAEYAGLTAAERTVGAKSANIEMAADEASQMIPLAREASMAVPRSGFLPFGKAQVMFDENTNDPALRKFAAANNALVNVYARAVSPNGVTTVSDKDHARAILATAHDQPSYNATLDMMQKEIETAQRAPGHVRSALNSALTGKNSTDATPTFKSEAEAAAAGLTPGTKIIINGQSGTWH